MVSGQYVRGASPLVVDVVIADGQTVSAATTIPGIIVGLEIPASAEGTAYYLRASSAIDGTYARVTDTAGSDVTITAASATAQYVAIEPSVTAGIVHVQLEAGTAQTGDSTFRLIVRPFC